jgi:hypothetical protein
VGFHQQSEINHQQLVRAPCLRDDIRLESLSL